jgi:hypothetical protein
MIKRTNSISDWYMFDTARGDTSVLLANSSAAQFTNTNFNLTSTGFDFDGTDFNEAGSSWIYMAFKDNYEYASTGTMAFMLIAGGGGGGVSTGTNTGITYVGCGGGAGGFRGSGKVTGGGYCYHRCRWVSRSERFNFFYSWPKFNHYNNNRWW